MKKIVCLILAFTLAFSLCACKKGGGNAENTTSAEAESSQQNTPEAQTAAEKSIAEETTVKGEEPKITVLEGREQFTLGEVIENGYENKSAGITISGLDESWSESTPQQIALIYDTGVDSDTEKAYAPSGGEDNGLCDVMYTNKDTDGVISVSYFESETPLNELIPEYEGNDLVDGFKNTEELVYLTVAGQRVLCKKLHYKQKKNIVNVPDLTEYDMYFMSESRKQIIKVVIVSFDAQADVDEILSHFSFTDNS